MGALEILALRVAARSCYAATQGTEPAVALLARHLEGESPEVQAEALRVAARALVEAYAAELAEAARAKAAAANGGNGTPQA